MNLALNGELHRKLQVSYACESTGERRNELKEKQETGAPTLLRSNTGEKTWNQFTTIVAGTDCDSQTQLEVNTQPLLNRTKNITVIVLLVGIQIKEYCTK